MAYGKISDKQREILEYIKKEILNKGYPPTVRDICEAVHLKSTSSVHSHLETLEKNGYIRRDPTKPRAIEIVDDNFNLTRREVVNVPMIGQVAAGQPMLAVENIDAYFPIPAEYMPNAESFMLKVKGESMINAGIFDGDNIIVERCSTAQNGEMVVALVDDSATVINHFRIAMIKNLCRITSDITHSLNGNLCSGKLFIFFGKQQFCTDHYTTAGC